MTVKDIKIGDAIHEMTSDDRYLEHIAQDFEPHMIKLFDVVINKGDTVLDIGANIGCCALFYGSKAREVHAFEPSPSTFNLLQTNIDKARMPQVHAHNIGLGIKKATMPLSFSPNMRAGAFISDKTQPSSGHVMERISIRKLDDVVRSLRLRRVDFIKIDVEGFEMNVIKGGRTTLRKHRPVVVLELNHWCLNAFQRLSVPEFFDFLRSIFPILYAVEGDSYMNLHDPGESYIVMYQHIVRNFRFSNIVAAFDPSQIVRFDGSYHHGFHQA
ncbi:MAG: FkbM family methyltransferase [Alphaproteobacteria bacterium]|nr:MAG: FkbM family methyltransferase [Alphaproteobacteria bacterium]